MAGDTLRINGNAHSWASTVLYIGNHRYYGVMAMSWDEKRERALVYGLTRAHGPRGKTSGKYTPGPLKMTFLTDSAVQLKQDLANIAADFTSAGNVDVPILVQSFETGLPAVNEEFYSCSWTSTSGSKEESPDPCKEELEFTYTRHIQNGVTLYDATEEGR
jgi:hypothetical protein